MKVKVWKSEVRSQNRPRLDRRAGVRSQESEVRTDRVLTDEQESEVRSGRDVAEAMTNVTCGSADAKGSATSVQKSEVRSQKSRMRNYLLIPRLCFFKLSVV
ncbi:MAG: hypothetical protein QNJ49_10855 [Mastigocoleus sp. MO_167.B18]|nr:hypothetical protein [Mastigocoleus sp. MO_167.B18]